MGYYNFMRGVFNVTQDETKPAPSEPWPAWCKLHYHDGAHVRQKHASPPRFRGYIIGWYERWDGHRGYVLEHERDRIVHIFPESVVAAGIEEPKRETKPMRNNEKYGPTKEINLFVTADKDKQAVAHGTEMLRQALIREHPARVNRLLLNQKLNRRNL